MTTPTGHLVTLADGEQAWQIDALEAMGPFLVSVVNAGDHWMYVSTGGGLTAGRVDATRCLFPYETDDRLHHAAGITGPITLVRTAKGELWQPFDDRGLLPGRRRTLRKGAMGNWLEFEEEATDLGLCFRYRWTTSDRFGLVRRATLDGAGAVEVLDGLLNVMPAEVPPLAQQGLSSLVDAYKRCERVGETLGLFALEAHLSDRAAPSEALRANVVWRVGLPEGALCLSARAVRDFRDARPTPARDVEVGARGAYLVQAAVELSSGPARWDLFADVHLDQVALTALVQRLAQPRGLLEEAEEDLVAGARALRRNVASADGLQHTADAPAAVHHFANVVFNNMRGGVFADGHNVPVADLALFLAERNRPIHDRHRTWLAALGDRIDHRELVARADATSDPQLVRLCLEYLPLTFSRRHGDPSRPWNAFNIRLRHPDGRTVYAYEGNWRDIFQNWEALARSFPAFLEPMVAKFVNASTRDGFNPYRLTREGIDWEVPNPEDPWSNIGYWGDHQIVYLFRLLEAAEAHRPGAILAWLGRDLFSYAAVPYRLRTYGELCRDAKDAIVFDEAVHERAERQVASVGGDGRLVWDARGQVLQVNLLEKLLVTVLAKLSNLVVDGGIWMNTQRPEWNDANNALVGQGLSMVTLAQLRRALTFLRPLVSGAGALPVSGEVVAWFEGVLGALAEERAGLDAAGSDEVDPGLRRRLLDRLGNTFGAYRAAIVDQAPGDRVPLSGVRVAALCDAALPWIDHSLRTNRRSDGLYHSYNLLTLSDGEARVARLYEMLEGQVAVIGSGFLTAEEVVEVIDALFEGALYRSDQGSFLLYPFRERPSFLARNRLGRAVLEATPLLKALAEAGDTRVIARDTGGDYRFQADLANAEVLAGALAELAAEPLWAQRVADGRDAVLAAYERVFDHHAFTGRSGTMYKYEGLGCIYWHMVSKLLLSVQEAWWRARDDGAHGPVLAALADRYYRIRRGLSFNKSVAEYGAVPSDPYSHTPAHMGAQQPGMTGQVKEEILTRMGELGVRVVGGRLTFEPRLLRRSELLARGTPWSFVGPDGAERSVEVPPNAVAFTVVQTPVILTVGPGEPTVEVVYADGRRERMPGRAMTAEATVRMFTRGGEVAEVHVAVPEVDLPLA